MNGMCHDPYYYPLTPPITHHEINHPHHTGLSLSCTTTSSTCSLYSIGKTKSQGRTHRPSGKPKHYKIMNKLFIGVGLMLCAAAVLPPPASADKGRKELQDSIKHADERDLHIPFVRVSFFTPFSGGQRTPRLPTPPAFSPLRSWKCHFFRPAIPFGSRYAVSFNN